MSFGYAHFPSPAGVLDRTQWRGARAPLMSADQDDVRMRLGNSGRDRTNPSLRDQLYTDAGAAINLLQIVDELRKIFDRINIVMWRRRNESYSSHRMPQAGNIGADLMAG